MPKKKLPELVHKDGWTMETGIAARCADCKKWINLGERSYWRTIKVGGISGGEIRCANCADKP